MAECSPSELAAQDRALRARVEIRVREDGVRDLSSHGGVRADESSGWVWEGAKALETALLTLGHGCDWETCRVLELGAGTAWLGLRVAQLGASVVTTDRLAAMPRILRNVVRNQQGCVTADGDDLLRVECLPLDWEDELSADVSPGSSSDTPSGAGDGGSGGSDGSAAVADGPSALRGPWDWVIGSDLIYLHEMHAPLIATLRRRAGGAPCLLSWTERKPVEEANFLRLAVAAGFECDLAHETLSEENGARVLVYRLRRLGHRGPL